jgi:hypothetical protein
VFRKDNEILAAGVQLALQIQQAIVDEGNLRMKKQSVIRLPNLRYMYMLNYPEDKCLFCHPLILQRLQYFINDTYLEIGSQTKPFLLGIFDSRKKAYAVAGSVGKSQRNTRK